MEEIMGWVLAAGAVLLTLEIISGRHRRIYRREDFFIGLGNLFLGRWVTQPLSALLIAGCFALITPERWHGALSDLSFWIAFPAVVLIGEFMFYWVHRWAHDSRRFPRFWKLHRTHHSGSFMNVFLFLRMNALWTFVHPAAWVAGLGLLLGLGEAVLGYLVWLAAWNIITHSHFRWDDRIRASRLAGPLFRALEHVFVSPGLHHTHHGYGKDGASYRNFGTIISLFDWMFGTLHIPEGRPFRYGLPGPKAHWAEELLYPLVQIKSPGEKPDTQRQQLN